MKQQGHQMFTLQWSTFCSPVFFHLCWREKACTSTMACILCHCQVVIVDPSKENAKDILKLAESFYVHRAPLRYLLAFVLVIFKRNFNVSSDIGGVIKYGYSAEQDKHINMNCSWWATVHETRCFKSKSPQWGVDLNKCSPLLGAALVLVACYFVGFAGVSIGNGSLHDNNELENLCYKLWSSPGIFTSFYGTWCSQVCNFLFISFVANRSFRHGGSCRLLKQTAHSLLVGMLIALLFLPSSDLLKYFFVTLTAL